MAYIPFLNNAYFSAKVGIGTESPLGELHVKNVSELYTDLDGSDAAVNFLDNNSDVWRIGIRASDNSFRFSQDATSLGSNVRFTIADGGNVGIGMTGPGVKLDVNGQIRSNNEFLLQTGTTAIGSIRNQSGALDIRSDSTRDVSLGSVTSPQALFIEGSNGNVGIGTTNPASELHIEASDNPNLKITRGGVNKVLLGDSGSNNGGDLLLYNADGTLTTLIRSGSSSYLNGGNVGIGTTTPSEKLEVVDGNVKITDGYLRVNSTNGANIYASPVSKSVEIWTVSSELGGDPAFRIKQDSSTKVDFGWDDEGTNEAFIWNYSNGGFKIGTNGSERFKITSTGNVGIGTTSPGTEANLSLGAKSTTEGGHLALFKGTSQTYATHIDNYTNSLRIMSGTDVNSSTVQFSLNHSSGAIQFNAYNSTNNTGTPTYLLGTDASGNIVKTNTVPGSGAGPYLPLAGGTMTGQIIMGNASNSFSHELKFANNTYIAGIDFQNSGELRFIDRSGGRESITFNLLNGSIEARNTGNTVTNFISTSGNSYFNGGNVGIGTTSPTKNLNLQWNSSNVNPQTGEGLSGGTLGTGVLLKNSNTTAGTFVNLDFRANNTDGRIAYTHNATNDGDFHFILDNTTASPLTRLFIEGETGNVGIGTDSPDSLLNLEGAKNTSIITLGSTTNNSSWSVGDKYGAIDFYSGDGSGAGAGIKASISYEVEAGATGSTNSMVFRSAGTSAGTNNTERMRITAAGNVGIGTDSPGEKLDVRNGTITSRDSGNINYAELDRFEGLTLKGNGAGAKYISTPNTDDLGFKTNNDEKMRITSGGNVGIGTTTPAAFLDIQPSTSSRKVTRIANDVTSTYFYNQQVDAILAWTCGSYYQAEVVITANQTNGGDYNNLYIRGIWSNNHTSHNWDELEHIGSLTGSTFTMSVGQNGSTTASGRLELDFNYISQSFSQLNVRVTDFFGTHSYTIT